MEMLARGMEKQNEKHHFGTVASDGVRQRRLRADGKQGIDDLGTIGGFFVACARGPSAAARRRRAKREKPERPERSPQQGKSGARQEDQEHLPRLLGAVESGQGATASPRPRSFGQAERSCSPARLVLRRTSTASASCLSTVAVVAQSMHPSVMLWP